MCIRGSVALCALAVGMAPRAGAQGWLTSFRPHPLCSPTISRAASRDLPPGTSRLILTLSLMQDGSAFDGEAVFGVLPLAQHHQDGWLRVSSTTGGSRMDTLPPGRYLVRSLIIGYEPTTDTILLLPDLVTTATLYMKELWAPFRCQPPGFRRPGVAACVLGPEDEVEFELKLAEEYAGPRPDSTRDLPPYRREEIRLVRDEAVCRLAGEAYGGPESPPRKVIVFELGQSGYMVYDPFEPITGGEFSSRVFFDRKWRPLFGLSL